MAWQYSEKTTQLFMDAVQGRPGTHLGEIDEPDGVGEHGSIACGDAMRFTFRVRKHPDDPKQDVITEARYLTFGCTSAIASSEALCALLEQKEYTPIEALKISNADIVSYLGGLPKQKIHCSVMGAEALEAAVFNWARKRGLDLAEIGVELPDREEQEGRIVCTCFAMSEPYIRRKIHELDLHSITDITHAIKAGGACTTCHHAPGGLQDLLDEIWGKGELKLKRHNPLVQLDTALPTRGPTVSPYQFAKAIEQTIDNHVRPILQKDGADVEVIDIKDHLVYARLAGSCSSCSGAAVTLKLTLEETLKSHVDERIRVIAV